MRARRNALAVVCGIALMGAIGPASAQTARQIKGVLERVDVSGSHVVVRETHGRRYSMPMSVGPDTEIETPAGSGQLAALRVGDDVTVSYAPGPNGQRARRIVVTKAAPPQ